MRPHVVHWLDGMVPTTLAQALAPSWFTCVGLAGVVALCWMLAIGRRHRLDSGVVASVVLWCYLAAVAAGIAVPLALDAAQQLLSSGRVQLRWAGMTSFWGYLAGAAAVAAVCRAHRLPLARFADLAAAPMGGALVLARLGCFLAGCDYGKVSSAPWAMRFPSGSPAWHDHVGAGLVPADRAESLPVHPTQLYEAVLGAVIIAVALAAARSRWARRDGATFLLAAATYAIGRLVIEGYRGDAGRGIYFGLSSGQIFSILVVTAIAARSLFRYVRAASTLGPRGRRVGSTSAVVVLVLAVAAPSRGHAQPRAVPPAPAPQPSAAPPTSAPQPISPYEPSAPPGAALPPAPPPIGPPPAPLAAAPPMITSLHAGVLLGLAAPLNRKRDQVAMLAGPSLSLGLTLRGFDLWLDLDSFGNTDASHGSLLVSLGRMTPVATNLQFGARLGLGATLVNFDDPAFRDVAGTAVRVDALADYQLGDSWSLWLRPLSFDVLSAAALGGPIVTWQIRAGVAYHFAFGSRPQPPAPGLASRSR